MKPADTVYNLLTDHLTKEETYMAVSLQGIVAQTAAQISIRVPADFRQTMEENYHITFIDTEDVWALVERFLPLLNGAVVYEDTAHINRACMVSGAYGYLAVHQSLLPKVQALGLEVKQNASVDYASEFDAFLRCRDHLDNTYVCHQLPGNPALRDYAIAARAPLYAGTDPEELAQIYDWVKDTGAVLGWYYDEVSGVGNASRHGLMTIPSDHAWNLSLYAALPAGVQKQKPYAPKATGKKVHYVTFLLSDGDNVQVHVNNYRTHNFASKRRGTIPYGWTTSPSMYDIAPLVNPWYYDRQTENDYFLAAVSGVGYCNPALLPKNVLSSYAQLSAEYMHKSDIHSTVLLMDSPEEQLINPEETKINSLYAITEAFSACEGIDGGFLYYGNLYCPVKTPGAVFWNHGKPFNAIRETLWHDGDKQEYMKNLAQRINSYPKDPTIPEGYTAINVQYWQYYYDEVADFAAMLDEDVVVVTPGEFLKLMTEQITCKETKLYLDTP